MENGNSRLRQAQEDVDEVAVIMLENLQKAEDRSGKLGELETRADELLEKQGFRKDHRQGERQKRWESIRMKVLLGGIVAVVVVVIVVVIVLFSYSSGTENHATSVAAPAREST